MQSTFRCFHSCLAQVAWSSCFYDCVSRDNLWHLWCLVGFFIFFIIYFHYQPSFCATHMLPLLKPHITDLISNPKRLYKYWNKFKMTKFRGIQSIFVCLKVLEAILIFLFLSLVLESYNSPYAAWIQTLYSEDVYLTCISTLCVWEECILELNVWSLFLLWKLF